MRNVAIPHYYKHDNANIKLKELVKNWNEIFPDKAMKFDEKLLELVVSSEESDDKFKPSELSDGERAIFYIIGQVLLAEEDTVVIIDEPELHIHKSIMVPLWSKLTQLKEKCRFIFLTHDLQFAATRGGQKFIIKNYSHNPAWEIEEIPEVSGIREEIYFQILGSRDDILFCEGTYKSKDYAVYQACFPDWTVIPRDDCDSVIKSVKVMRKVMKKNPNLLHINCVGIIDRDFRTCEEVKKLSEKGILVLPVLKIENLILIPVIFEKIANLIKNNQSLSILEKDVRIEIIKYINDPNKVEESSLRFAFKMLDHAPINEGLGFEAVTKMFNESLNETGNIELSISNTIEKIKEIYINNIENTDIAKITKNRQIKFGSALNQDEENVEILLQIYDYGKELLKYIVRELLELEIEDFDKSLKDIFVNKSHEQLITTTKYHLRDINEQLVKLKQSNQKQLG